MWSAPTGISSNITAYNVYCRTSDTQAYPEQVVSPNQPTIRSTVNGTQLKTVFSTGLNPFTQYDCYATASISISEGPHSTIATNRTDESTPSSPRKLSLSTVRYFPNLIIATWTPPIPKNGIITAYSVYCNTSVNSLIIGAKTNATTLVVTINTGSVMFTQYSCYVTANTSIGEGTPSQMITIESLPSAPLNFSMAPISGSPDMLLAMWTAPAQKNSAIITYTVYCNTSATQAYIEPLVVNGTTFTAIIDNDLGPYSQYDCYVTANTSAGEGMASDVMTARTSESMLAVQSSDSTVKAVSATLATVIAIFLIVIVAAVAARALIMRKYKRSFNAVLSNDKKDSSHVVVSNASIGEYALTEISRSGIN
eukprot:Em0004g431a